MTESLALWDNSTFARDTFGDEVVEHYANMARVEVDSFYRVVTDWELGRNFERS
jgi:glutamine synthetase